jgi:hypothetical protein
MISRFERHQHTDALAAIAFSQLSSIRLRCQLRRHAGHSQADYARWYADLRYCTEAISLHAATLRPASRRFAAIAAGHLFLLAISDYQPPLSADRQPSDYAFSFRVSLAS